MTKKYILKPGKHQFAPNSAAIHSNDNLTDEEAEWYLEKYPHIVSLFAPLPPEGGASKSQVEKVTAKTKPAKSLHVESLTPPPGGKGGI